MKKDQKSEDEKIVEDIDVLKQCLLLLDGLDVEHRTNVLACIDVWFDGRKD